VVSARLQRGGHPPDAIRLPLQRYRASQSACEVCSQKHAMRSGILEREGLFHLGCSCIHPVPILRPVCLTMLNLPCTFHPLLCHPRRT
jgi:hypothetical protein